MEKGYVGQWTHSMVNCARRKRNVQRAGSGNRTGNFAGRGRDIFLFRDGNSASGDECVGNAVRTRFGTPWTQCVSEEIAAPGSASAGWRGKLSRRCECLQKEL